MAFPCNQFGGQEPKSEEEIKEWIATTYSIDFPIMAKGDVIGENASPIYKNIVAQAPDSDINWNFAKFLLNGQGEVVKFYAPQINPEDMMADITPLLNQ